MTILRELSDATKLERQQGEVRTEYIDRLIRAVNNLSDKEWDTLSEPTQMWFNNSVDALAETKPVPIPEDEPAEDPVVVATPETTTTTVTSIPNKGGRVVGYQSGKKSGSRRAKEIVVEDPKVTLDMLSKRLVDEGYKLSLGTLQVLLPDTLQTLQILQEKGLLKAV